MHDSDMCAGVGVDNPRDKWVYDTTQFDNILKKLKVVRHIKITISAALTKFRFTMSNNCSHLFLVILWLFLSARVAIS